MTVFFIFPLTILLTLGGLIFVVVSYFKRNPEPDELERILFKVSVTPQNFYQQQLPGELLAYAIPGIIIWYLFFKKIMKEV